MRATTPLRVRLLSSAGVAPPLVVLDRAAAREVDRAAVDTFGLPGLVLMENAAAALARVCFEAIGSDPRGALALALCGPGNNGGDGFACARRLANAGVRVAIVTIDEPKPGGDAGVNLHALRAMRNPACEIRALHAAQSAESARRAIESVVDAMGEPTVVLDAMLGTGLDRPLAPAYLGAVEWVNAHASARGLPVIAADIPTGLDCDTGRPVGAEAVRATTTVTFAGLKRGFLAPESRAWVGRAMVADIGVPTETLTRLGRPLSPEEGVAVER